MFAKALPLAWLCLLVACSEGPTAPLRPVPTHELTSSLHAAPGASSDTEAASPLRIAGLSALVERAIAKGELPGCVVEVGSSRGPLYVGAFGERADGEPMTADTLFDLASVTKAVATTTAIFQLIEAGKLSLETPVHRILPQLARRDKRAITVRHLLLHVSGLRSVLPLSQFDEGPDHALERIARSRLTGRVGEVFNYSDLGFILLGRVVEAVSGRSLSEYTEEHIFARLGMPDTGYLPDPALVARIAPTEERDGAPIRGTVDDPRAYRLGGVAGHAGVFSTAADLGRFARALLQQGALEGRRILAPSSVATMTRVRAAGDVERALGWDVQSGYSIGRGELLSRRAFGHGGYTGTSLWIDPARDLYVILLSNRVHRPGGTIHPLTSSVNDLAAHAVDELRARPGSLSLGIDELAAEAFARLRGRRVGVLSHYAARNAAGISTLEVLLRHPDVRVETVFAPEHGLASNKEGALADSRLGARRLPVYSLFGRHRKPSPRQLRGLDVVVIDLVDVGTRFYTYMSTALAMLEACDERGIDVLVLDRPNPIGADVVEGPVSEPAFASFVNYAPLPLRHGLTAAELLRLLSAERGYRAPDVVELAGYERHMHFSDTGLAWHAPSPNLMRASQALLYPAIGLLEATSLSVGRGTQHAFEVLGAPFVDPAELCTRLTPLLPSCVAVEPTSFVPRVGPHKGRQIPGVRFTVRDPRAYRAAPLGLAIARAVLTLYGEHIDDAKLGPLLAHQPTLDALRDGAALESVPELWESSLESFEEKRRRSLIYGVGPSPSETEASRDHPPRIGNSRLGE